MLSGKKFILGITGSIAAYKAACLTRLLKKQGAEVKIVITPLGKEFITPVTLATLSENAVLCDFFTHEDGDWNSHVDLGLWADAMIIAPATANTMAKMAHGVADNLLLTTYLSARCPVIVAPAMDLDMFQHPATQANLKTLESYGNHIIEPATGELASGLEGKGRMEEPERIVSWLEEFFKKKKRLSNKTVLVTAGPTFEKIDPVRYLGNYSSGKMGLAVADELLEQGASVKLVLGPVANLTGKAGEAGEAGKTGEAGITGEAGNVGNTGNMGIQADLEVFHVKSAEEMFEVAAGLFNEADVAVFAAAVADFRPVEAKEHKIKEKRKGITLDLVPNPDIALELGNQKSPAQITVGFALESDDGLDAAIAKKDRKNFDLIVLNSLQDPGAGFGGDTNQITLIGKDNNPKRFELKTKKEVAQDIVDAIHKLCRTN